MDLYTFSLVLGGAGLAAMGLNSLGHQAGSSHSNGHGHGHGHGHSAGPSAHGHGHGHSHPIAHQDGHHGHSHPSDGLFHAGSISRTALALLSPRVLFSVFLGLGLTGILARNLISGLPLLATAIVGGLLFERLAVAPLWNFLLRFASRPALTLESCITDEATAVTGFDSRGQGLIAVELDGQVVQLLGTLQASDREAGIRVKAGDRVRIEEVDAGRNRCTVSVP